MINSTFINLKNYIHHVVNYTHDAFTFTRIVSCRMLIKEPKPKPGTEISHFNCRIGIENEEISKVPSGLGSDYGTVYILAVRAEPIRTTGP